MDLTYYPSSSLDMRSSYIHYNPLLSYHDNENESSHIPNKALLKSKGTNVSSRRNSKGFCFVFVIAIVIVLMYLCYFVLMILPSILYLDVRMRHEIPYIVLFHILFLFFLLAFSQSATTDAGTVPPNWGFYMGEVNKRRRYCKLCNIWKPDRTHHCSACDRCVLNMDHHCPWINNCVGFYNRKYFIQLLTYCLLVLLVTLLHTCIKLYQWNFIVMQYDIENHDLRITLNVAFSIAIVMFLTVNLLLLFPLIPFITFHLRLVAMNSTTLDNLIESQNRSKESLEKPGARYNIGFKRNCFQVMGPNVWLWWLPCNVSSSSRPSGDGITWHTPPSRTDV